jgi:acyl carrier protein
MPPLAPAELMKIFAEILEVPAASLNDQSSPENVAGWDSAKSMEIVVTIEEAAGGEFTADELDRMSSIGAIKEILVNRGALSK